MKNVIISISVFLSLAMFGCKSSQEIDFEAEQAAILSADSEFSNAVAAKNVEALGQLFDRDAIFVINGGKSHKGNDAVTKRYQDFFSDTLILSVTRKPVEAVVFECGNLGYSIGDWENVRINAAGGKYNTSGSYLFIWKKQKDGKWKAFIIKT